MPIISIEYANNSIVFIMQDNENVPTWRRVAVSVDQDCSDALKCTRYL